MENEAFRLFGPRLLHLSLISSCSVFFSLLDFSNIGRLAHPHGCDHCRAYHDGEVLFHLRWMRNLTSLGASAMLEEARLRVQDCQKLTLGHLLLEDVYTLRTIGQQGGLATSGEKVV